MTRQHITNISSEKTIRSILFLLRMILALSVVAYAAIELMKFNSNKEILHLTMFSMFFLLASFQINVGRHNAVVNSNEAGKLFILTLFSFSAALLELVDLALDQILKELNQAAMPGYFFGVSLTESLFGFAAVLMIFYSLEGFLVFLNSIVFKLKGNNR